MKKLSFCIGSIVLLHTITAFQSFAAETLIHACFQTSSTNMRVVSGPDQCKENEFYLSWNETGTHDKLQNNSGTQSNSESSPGPQG